MPRATLVEMRTHPPKAVQTTHPVMVVTPAAEPGGGGGDGGPDDPDSKSESDEMDEDEDE